MVLNEDMSHSYFLLAMLCEGRAQTKVTNCPQELDASSGKCWPGSMSQRSGLDLRFYSFSLQFRCHTAATLPV
eukprot:2094976-Amphidinium_carterae.1